MVLAIDQGGQSTRAVLYGPTGEKLGSAAVPVSENRPAPGRVEQDPEELVRSVESSVSTLLGRFGSHAGPVGCKAGLATQRAGTICWNRETGEPLTPVLSWQDTRGAEILDRFQASSPFPSLDAEIHARTGLRLSPHYGVGKLLWCLQTVPAVKAAQEAGRLACGPLASFLLFRCVDGRPFQVDPANGGRMLLYGRKRSWDPVLLETFGILPEWLPEPVPTLGRFGRLAGIDGKVELTAVTGDQSAVPFCRGNPSPDTMYINLGTGAFLQQVVQERRVAPEGLLTSVILDDGVETMQVVEGTVNGAASALNLHPAPDGTLDLLSTPAPPLFLNGVSGLGSPWWNARFRSEFVGEGDAQARRDGVAESILFLVRTNLDRIAQAGKRPGRILAAGGLARSEPLMQGLAALCRLPVDRLTDPEATAAGAAFLAAGRPAEWEGAGVERFEPSRRPVLEERYARWTALMEDRLANPPAS